MSAIIVLMIRRKLDAPRDDLFSAMTSRRPVSQ
jgi:hypothetical protein